MNLRHEIFIREMIAHGNRKQAYLAAYPFSSANAAYNNACRLLANPQIHNRIQNALQEAEQECKAVYGEALANTYEKRVLLARVINNALYPETICNPFQLRDKQEATDFVTVCNRKETIRNRKKQAEKIPTVSQVLRAIVLDTKLEYGWKQKL